MEFKLNKIDMDIRHRLKEENSDKKVLNSKDINPSKDTIQKKNDFKNNSKKKSNDNSKKQKRFITIDGIKYSDTIYIQAEKVEKTYEENYKGQILDLKK